MQFFSGSSLRILLKLHRWGALLLAMLVIFYCLTGILLNHRKSFDYFQRKTTRTDQIKTTDSAPMQAFLDFYKAKIDRNDNPTVIRIKNSGTIEFLYGSHGKTTYTINPGTGEMQIIDKHESQPWYWLNSLHKASKTSDAWLYLSDSAAVIILLITISGLFIVRYRPLELGFALAGLLIMIFGALLA